MPLDFVYFRNQLSEIDLQQSDSKYQIFYLEGPFQLKSSLHNNASNTRTVIDVVQSANGSSIVDTYTFFASDAENHTLGVLQYSLNYSQSGGGSITFLPELQGNVSFACGMFHCYRFGKVTQKYDNLSEGKPRFIRIQAS